MSARTLEQRLKFDCGLTIGTHLVRFTIDDRERLALVRISPRGKVSYLPKPEPEDMYSTWRNCHGDKSTADGVVHVWAARSQPELMAAFDGEPVTTVPLTRPKVAP